MFVEIWLHHYSLEMYQKLQSPQVKVREILPPPIPPPLHCSIARLFLYWLTTAPPPHPPHTFPSSLCPISERAQGWKMLSYSETVFWSLVYELSLRCYNWAERVKLSTNLSCFRLREQRMLVYHYWRTASLITLFTLQAATCQRTISDLIVFKNDFLLAWCNCWKTAARFSALTNRRESDESIKVIFLSSLQCECTADITVLPFRSRFSGSYI